VDRIGTDSFGVPNLDEMKEDESKVKGHDRDEGDDEEDKSKAKDTAKHKINGHIGTVRQLVYYSSGVGSQSVLSMDSGFAGLTGEGIVPAYTAQALDEYAVNRQNRRSSEYSKRILLHLQQLQLRLYTG
jgi:hypothetical protein